MTLISEEAYEGISAEIVYIPDGATEIEARAFAGCQNLRYVHIPDSVEMISSTAFEECPEDLVIYGSEGSWAMTFAEEHGIEFIPE